MADLLINMLRNRFSLFTLILIGFIYLASIHFYSPWKKGIVNGGDAWGYYLYLPAVFIHHDLDNIKTSLETRSKYHPKGQSSIGNPLGVDEMHHLGDDKQVNKYTVGVAILNLPFFLIGHVAAYILDFPPDGYSLVYRYFIFLAGVVYSFLGFLLLRWVLRRMVGDSITAITLLVTALATNLYFFSVISGPMSHVYLFFLYALLLYSTINWYRSDNLKYALLVGLSCGFITLIRPSEMICLLIPVFWGITSILDLKMRLNHVKVNWKAYFLSVICFILAGLPQLIYWKWITGKFIHYSYTNETFDFAHPHIIEGIFGYSNGWLAYTPVMYLALIGILFLRKGGREALWPVLLFLPLHIYITYSWWNWFYINGFGSRPMVQTYALLSIPLAFFFRGAFSWNTFSKIVVSGVLIFVIWLNLFNVYQFTNGLLWTENANWAYYKRIFGKTWADHLDLATYDTGEMPPDESKLTYVKTVYENNFEDSVSVNFTSAAAQSGKYSVITNQGAEYSPGVQATVKELGLKPGDWLKVKVSAMRPGGGDDIYRMALLVFEIAREGQEAVKWKSLRINNKPGNTTGTLWGGKTNVWGDAWFWTQVPENVQETDVVKLFGWNNTANTVYLDDMKMELWRPVK